MRIPTVHLNGTGKTTLLAELEAAHSAVHDAVDALLRVTVHERDYYVQEPGAYEQARDEQQARLRALSSVESDLLAMHIAVARQ